MGGGAGGLGNMDMAEMLKNMGSGGANIGGGDDETDSDDDGELRVVFIYYITCICCLI